MTRRVTDGLQRAYFLWTIAGTSLIVAAAAGAAVVEVFRGTADAGTSFGGSSALRRCWSHWCFSPSACVCATAT